MFRRIYRKVFEKQTYEVLFFRNKSVSKSQSTPTFRMTGSAVLQVLGSGSSGSPKVLYLFTDQHRYLFNCGEGTQRLAHEHKMKLSRLEHIFLTSATWESLGGLPGISLTLQENGVDRITLHGPPGLNELFIATQKFVVLNTMGISMAKCDEDSHFQDSSMSVKYVLLHRKNCTQTPNDSKIVNSENQIIDNEDNDYYDHEYSGKRQSKNIEFQNLLTLPKKQSFVCVSFICRLKDRLGTLDLQKCVNKGVKPGPMLGLLKNGQNVTLSDGTVVYASDVKTPDQPGPVFIVIDVPDIEYLDSLVESEGFKMHQEKTATCSQDLPDVIVHFTPENILKSEKYQSFINTFPPSTKHLIVNNGNECYNSIAVQRVQQKLNLLHNDMFPLVNHIDEKNYDKTDDHDATETNNALNDSDGKFDIDTLKINANNKCIRAKTLTLYCLSPKKGLDRSCELKRNPSEYITEAFANEGFSESLKNFHDAVTNLKETASHGKYPMIVFLGTGSCIPNKTRNTSGIMIHIDENHCILFDCGEGTFGQMVKFYGKHNIHKTLHNLKAIYISHLHADHHIGLINILQGRKQALRELHKTDSSFPLGQKLYLLAPHQIMSWLNLYNKRFEEITDSFSLLPNMDFMKTDNNCSSEPNELTNFLKDTRLSELKTCWVRHCPNAFGITMTTSNGKKITYSGDTMPCENLVKMGFNSDILIHEATMEDDLHEEAAKKLHSTIGQAADIGGRMNAEHTILTHFSQRYARVPRLSEDIEKVFYTNNVGIAFDNMKITYDNLNILPHMYPPLKLMFADHCEELEIKAAKRALKRGHSPVSKKPK